MAVTGGFWWHFGVDVMKTLTRWAAVSAWTVVGRMAAGVFGRCLVIGVVGLLLVMSAGADEVYRPVVPIVQVAHVGEPVSGVAEATYSYVAPPQIDAAGNVLFAAVMEGPGITYDNNSILLYGPPGALTIVAREGEQAPGLPEGVYYASVNFFEGVSETGWITLTAILGGAGIVLDVNDLAVFCGPPWDLQLVLQAGDPVPEIGPDAVVSAETMGGRLSDNGTLFVGGLVVATGPAYGNKAFWVGSRDDLQLAAWAGMPVPGCPECQPGVYMYWVSSAAHNDSGEIAFLGQMHGPGIFVTNDRARWIGTPGALEMMYRGWQPVPIFGPDAVVGDAVGTGSAMNAHGDRVNRLRLFGPGSGISAANDWVLVVGSPQPTVIIAREGDPVPELGEGVYLSSVGSPFINNQRQVLFYVLLDGAIEYCGGTYFGPYDDARLILRDGDPANYFPSGSILWMTTTVGGCPAMNDVGDFVGMTEVHDGVGGIRDVWWMWHRVTEQLVPLLVHGQEIEGRTVTITPFQGEYWDSTGGADGKPQSFNDRRQLVTKLRFTDGTCGIYLIGPPQLGDIDGDGEVTAVELAAFADCETEAGGALSAGCEALDLSLDGVIDLVDFRMLQGMVGEPR
jgi:hypothetical protein